MMHILNLELLHFCNNGNDAQLYVHKADIVFQMPNCVNDNLQN